MWSNLRSIDVKPEPLDWQPCRNLIFLHIQPHLHQNTQKKNISTLMMHTKKNVGDDDTYGRKNSRITPFSFKRVVSFYVGTHAGFRHANDT
jgi:hypothetical protein